MKIGVNHTITYEPLLTNSGDYILTADGEIILVAVRNTFTLRIPIRKACQGYYLRWYYNGWHYWFFLPGRIITNTEGEQYYTIGTRKIAMGSGQVTYGQINALRTIRNSREIQLLTVDGWMNVRIEPGSVIVENNHVNGYEFDFIAIVGSREGLYSPVEDVPEVPGNPHAITITHHNVGVFTMILTGHGVIVIDWGDGTPPETYTLTDIPLVITHDYTGTTGEHTITIEGEENIVTLTADGQHITEITIPDTATSLTELHLPNNELTDSPYIPDTVPLVIMDLLNNPLTICEVYIGSQIWMCLNYDSSFPSSKVYNDNETNRALYGGLYTYSQVMTPGFVIAGWHVPTYNEWLALVTFAGGFLVAGGKLKEAGVVRWNAPNTGAVDTYGFTMPSTGLFLGLYGFVQIKEKAQLWTADESDSNHAWTAMLQYDHADIMIYPELKSIFCGVRLLKNFSYALPSFGVMTDYDGNIYTYITIGTQQWIIQNLRTTHYADGTPIPNLILDAAWIADLTGAYCAYNNDPLLIPDYGLLYNWYAVNNVAGICYFEDGGGIPIPGWRMANNADFNTLSILLGGSAVAGGKLKEAGLAHWIAPNTGATDDYGFKGVPSGFRTHTPGTFATMTTTCYLWSATEQGVNTASMMTLAHNNTAFTQSSVDKNYGFAIRCVRDV